MDSLIKNAFNGGYAIPQFNINNLEWAKYILEACNDYNSPVILGVSEGAIKYMGGYNVVAAMVKAMIQDLNIIVPVTLHLDHASTFLSWHIPAKIGSTIFTKILSTGPINTHLIPLFFIFL